MTSTRSSNAHRLFAVLFAVLFACGFLIGGANHARDIAEPLQVHTLFPGFVPGGALVVRSDPSHARP